MSFFSWTGFIHVGKDIPLENTQQSIITEVSFIMSIILLHLFNTVLSYSRNFKNFLVRGKTEV